MERLQRKCKVYKVKPWGVVGLAVAAAAQRLEVSRFRVISTRPVYSPEVGVSGKEFRGGSDSLMLAINDSVKESMEKKRNSILYIIGTNPPPTHHFTWPQQCIIYTFKLMKCVFSSAGPKGTSRLFAVHNAPD